MNSHQITINELDQVRSFIIQCLYDIAGNGITIKYATIDDFTPSQQRKLLAYFLESHSEPWEFLTDGGYYELLANGFISTLTSQDVNPEKNFIKTLSAETEFVHRLQIAAFKYHRNHLDEIIHDTIPTVLEIINTIEN